MTGLISKMINVLFRGKSRIDLCFNATLDAGSSLLGGGDFLWMDTSNALTRREKNSRFYFIFYLMYRFHLSCQMFVD